MRYLSCFLLAGLLGTAGCQSHKVAFQFRPGPAYSARRPSPPPPDTLPLRPPGAAWSEQQIPARATKPDHQKQPAAARPLRQRPGRGLAAVQAPLRRFAPKVRRTASTAGVQLLGSGAAIGLVLIGVGLAVVLLTLLLAASVASLEGFFLLLLGLGFGGALVVAGLVTAILGLVVH